MSDNKLVEAVEDHIKLTDEEIEKMRIELEDLKMKNIALALKLITALEQGRALPPLTEYPGVQ